MFTPLNDRVIVLVDEADLVSPGGIIIPEQAKKRPIKGTIARVGTGEKMKDGSHVAPTVKIGERVIFSKLAGMDVETDEPGQYLLIRECDILCVVEE